MRLEGEAGGGGLYTIAAIAGGWNMKDKSDNSEERDELTSSIESSRIVVVVAAVTLPLVLTLRFFIDACCL